jgi:hypothetical protein
MKTCVSGLMASWHQMEVSFKLLLLYTRGSGILRHELDVRVCGSQVQCGLSTAQNMLLPLMMIAPEFLDSVSAVNGVHSAS